MPTFDVASVKRRFLLLGVIGFCTTSGFGQGWDSSGNALLNGNYYFREVIFTATAAISLYGNIVFSGGGTYTINAVGFQCDSVSCGLNPYQTSGTYSIAASGFGFLSNQLLGSPTYGSVGVSGVFAGSSTESGYYDLFIGAPISGQNTATLQGSYSLAYLYPGAQTPYDALLQMNASGGGNIGTVTVAAYATSATPLNQSIGGVKYIVSNNAFVVTFPNSTTNVVSGQEYLYTTPDGSFVFGGSPQDFDMIAGVRTSGTGSTNLGDGLYYEAGMDVDNSALASTGSSFADGFYGAFNASGGVIVGHQRIQSGGAAASNYVYHDAYTGLSNNGYLDLGRSRQYLVANGFRVGLGIGPYPAVSIGVRAAPASGGAPGAVYLNPIGPLNAASQAPFTSGISSGELILLTGSNLGPAALAVAPAIPLPLTLAGVQVLINENPVPILTATASQILAQVPFGMAAGSVAQIQVSFKGAVSNTITTLVNATTPGVFTTPLGGVNRASARHADLALVTPANPAKTGETISVYVTGLGEVSPAVANGAAGPARTPSEPVNSFAFSIGGVAATPSFVGLAPGLAALYLVTVPIPSGLVTGDAFLAVAGPDSYSIQATVAVTSAAFAGPATGTAVRPQPRAGRPFPRLPESQRRELHTQ